MNHRTCFQKQADFSTEIPVYEGEKHYLNKLYYVAILFSFSTLSTMEFH